MDKLHLYNNFCDLCINHIFSLTGGGYEQTIRCCRGKGVWEESQDNTWFGVGCFGFVYDFWDWKNCYEYIALIGCFGFYVSCKDYI